MKVGLKTSSGPKFTDRMLEMGGDDELSPSRGVAC
jgi:hypothetical protein